LDLTLTFLALQILKTLVWSPDHKAAEYFAFNKPEELAKVWKADGGSDKDLPAVDWKNETVIAVFAGQKNSGGFSIKIEGVSKALGEVYVLYREETPPKGSMQTRQLTFPSHVVVVKKTFGKFRFVNAESKEAETLRKNMAMTVKHDPTAGD
jgi:hypothetical protein